MTASLTTAGNYNDRAKSWLLNSLVIFTLTFFLLLPCHVLAQVTFPAQTVGTSNQENPTIAHTSPAGTNTLLVVTTSGKEDNKYLNWVRWNGSEELTLLISHDDGDNLAKIWYLINPTSGNHDVTSNGGIVEWWSVKTFHGVDQTNPFDSPADTKTNQGEGPNPSVGIITTADNMTTEVVSFKEEDAQTDPTNGGSVEDSDSWPKIEPHGATSHTDLSGNITVGWQDSDGTSWVIIVADILAAAGATSADLALTKTDSADPVTVSTNFTYTLTVTNNGPDVANNVSLVDTLPATVAYQSDTPSQGSCVHSGEPFGGTVTCSLGTIANSANATVAILVTAPGTPGGINNSATVSADETDPVAGNNTANEATTIIAAVDADMALTKTDSQDPVPVSTPFTYTLTATNNGPASASNVTVVDTLPADVAFQLAIPSQGSCVHSGEPLGGTVTCSLGTIVNAANATVDIDIDSPITIGPISNTAVVSADETDPVPADNTAIEPTSIVVNEANLRVVKVDDLDPNGVNLPITYTVTITNQGPGAATGVTLVDTLDPLTTYFSAVPSQGVCGEAAGVVTCTIGALANGVSATVVIVAIAPPTPQPLGVVNTAVVSGVEPDFNLVDNTAVENTVITNPPPADLQLIKTDSPDPVVEGNTLTYTLTVTNLGPGPAANTLVVDTLPPGVTWLTSTPSTGSCLPPSPTVDCDLGTLSNGAVETVVITVIAPLGSQVITNNAIVSTSRVDPVAANDVASADTTVTVPGGADIALSKSDSPDPVNVVQTLSYTLTVDNLGPDPATDVVLVDTLPATVAYQSVVPSQGSCIHSGEPFGGTVTCTMGTIANAANASANIFVTAPVSTGTITNNASISTSAVDGNPLNDTASEDTEVVNLNINQLCYLVADAGGGGGGNDLLTRIDTADFDPVTNETNIGIGTGTNRIEAIAWNSATSTLYAADAGQLGILNTTTGVFAALPSTFGTGDGADGLITFTDVDGLAYDATTTTLFGVEVQGGGGDDVLIKINMATGAHVPDAFGLGIDYVPLPAILGNSITDDIAVDPITGIMYAAVNAGGSTDRLITINKDTGITSDIAEITVPDIEGLGTDVTGQLWGTSGTLGILYEISKTTGVGSNGRTIDNGSDYEAVDCDQLSPGVVADLGVTKSVDNATPNELSTINYTIVVTNNGPATANVIQLSDVLPAGVTYVSDTPTQGSYDSFTGNWFVGTLTVSSTATLTIQATVNAGTGGSTITNTASVTFLIQSDPNPANDSDSVDIDPVALSNPVVNSTRDLADIAPGNGVCDTGALNTQGATECTLRAAIEEANALAGADNIDFNIPTTELGYLAAPLSYTIQTGSVLPIVSEEVVIDGSTQPDFLGTPIIVIDGVSAGAGVRGLELSGGADGSTIRGLVIINFTDRGIHTAASTTTIAGNWIGLAVNGVTAAGNGSEGLYLTGAADGNTIGGTVALDRNVISGNTRGIRVHGDNNVISGNYVGTDSAGAVVVGIGNTAQGIRLHSGADNNMIGGPTAADANIIAGNDNDGIDHRGTGTANSFLRNSIHSNSNIGIDLANDGATNNGANGVTANDADDPDPGANNLLNFAVITSAIDTTGTLNVDFDLDVPAGSYRIEFFTNPSGADGTGNGEGETYQSTVTIVHGGTGVESFSHSFAGSTGDILTTTATEEFGGPAYGATSEFSAAFTATGLTIVKRAFWPDGTPIPSGVDIPSGVEFKYLLYINNTGAGITDVSVRDVLDPAFLYQTPSIQVDNSVLACALATCDPGEEATIFTAVDGATVLSDVTGDDVVSYGALTIDAGDENAANAQLNILANRVWAILFSVKMP